MNERGDFISPNRLRPDDGRGGRRNYLPSNGIRGWHVKVRLGQFRMEAVVE